MNASITYHEAVTSGACQSSLDAMGKHLGGWHEYGRGTPVPLVLVLDTLGLDDCLWAIEVADERVARLVASDFAAHVHDVWDARFPRDTRPADAIRATRGWALGEVTEADRLRATWAARAARAAWAAGAAWAARDAWAAGAAGDAERGWQVRHLRAVVSGRKQPGRVRIARSAIKGGAA